MDLEMSGIQRTERANQSLCKASCFIPCTTEAGLRTKASASDPDTELHSRCIHGWSRGVGAPREDTVNRSCGETITMWGGTGRECRGLSGSEHLSLTPVMLKLRALEEQGNNTEVAELLTMMLVLLGNADRVKGPRLCSQRWWEGSGSH